MGEKRYAKREMKNDKLTFYPPAKYRNFQEVYAEVRYDYLFTDLSRDDIRNKYNLGYQKNLDNLILQIKQELGLNKSTNRTDIQTWIMNGELEVEEWI